MRSPMAYPGLSRPGRRTPGPRRSGGSPAGPEAVRRAVLDAAADLFARRDVEGVSLRDIAAAADVQLALIGRYVGTRGELIDAVFEDLSASIARERTDRPLEQISFERDSTMGRWIAVLHHLVVTGAGEDRTTASFNPVRALARVLEENYELAGRGGGPRSPDRRPGAGLAALRALPDRRRWPGGDSCSGPPGRGHRPEPPHRRYPVAFTTRACTAGHRAAVGATHAPRAAAVRGVLPCACTQVQRRRR